MARECCRSDTNINVTRGFKVQTPFNYLKKYVDDRLHSAQWTFARFLVFNRLLIRQTQELKYCHASVNCAIAPQQCKWSTILMLNAYCYENCPSVINVLCAKTVQDRAIVSIEVEQECQSRFRLVLFRILYAHSPKVRLTYQSATSNLCVINCQLNSDQTAAYGARGCTERYWKVMGWLSIWETFVCLTFLLSPKWD